jgi:hypothetical protein
MPPKNNIDIVIPEKRLIKATGNRTNTKRRDVFGDHNSDRHEEDDDQNSERHEEDDNHNSDRREDLNNDSDEGSDDESSDDEGSEDEGSDDEGSDGNEFEFFIESRHEDLEVSYETRVSHVEF